MRQRPALEEKQSTPRWVGWIVAAHAWAGWSYGWLEESHTELQKDIATGTKAWRVLEDRFLSPDKILIFVASFGQGPRMHLEFVERQSERNVERRVHRVVTLQFKGKHQPGYVVHDFGRQRFYATADGGVADCQKYARNGGRVWIYLDLLFMACRLLSGTQMRDKKGLKLRLFDEKKFYQGLGSGFRMKKTIWETDCCCSICVWFFLARRSKSEFIGTPYGRNDQASLQGSMPTNTAPIL